ncbi:hypothetical protein MPSEU_000503000 [Mayamaea pseudoterrestris]|nr:hypothetical protein MPSEU_000503000 [Mayamaea pseudoterrestris]
MTTKSRASICKLLRSSLSYSSTGMYHRLKHTTNQSVILLIILLGCLQQNHLGLAFILRPAAFACKLTSDHDHYRSFSPLYSNSITEYGSPEHTLVYLVDDEISIRTAVGRFLADQKYFVQTFADAQVCLQQLIKIAKRQPTLMNDNTPLTNILPKVLISDIRMPGMDGLELLQAIRSDESLMDLPVILLTAKGRTPDRIQGYNAGADAYIPKPFDPDELVSVMEQVLRTHASFTSKTNAASDMQSLKRDMMEIKQLLLDQGGGGAGMNGFVNNKDAKNEERVFLTPDERVVVSLLCEGLMNKEIAAKMSLSQPRVASLLTQLFRKTRVKNRTELARWAISNGIVQV